MAENYFDTQSLLGVVIRDPKILGADITGQTMTINQNYDWPTSGKPFVPGYSYNLRPDSGFSITYASEPQAGDTLMNITFRAPADRMRQLNFNGRINATTLAGDFDRGGMYARRVWDWLTDPISGYTITDGVEVGGQFIVTDRARFMEFVDAAGANDFNIVDEIGSLGVASRMATQGVGSNDFPAQMVMHTSNKGDTQFQTKDVVLEIDKAGAAITPKIGPGATADEIKFVSGTLGAGNTRSSITLNSSGSATGIPDVTITGRLLATDPYSRANSSGRLMTVGSTGSIGYTTTPSMTRAWGTSTTTASLTSTAHALQAGATAGLNLAIGPSEIVGRNNGAATPVSMPTGIDQLPTPTAPTHAATKAYVDTQIAEIPPPSGGGGTTAEVAGQIIPWAGTGTAPTGFLLCDGAAVSRTAYAELFAAIGTTFGAGNGTTTFNVPNLTGKFLREGTPGTTGGSDTHQHTLSDAGQAAITFVASTTPNIFARRVASTTWTATHQNGFSSGAGGSTTSQSVASALVGNTDAGSTLPAYAGMKYLICTGQLGIITASDTGWVNAPITGSGWVSSTAADMPPTAQVRKVGNRVQLRGRASGTLTVGTTTVILTLPSGFHPPTSSNMNAVATTAGFVGWSNVTSTGAVSVHFKTPFATGAAVVDFSGISYYTD